MVFIVVTNFWSPHKQNKLEKKKENIEKVQKNLKNVGKTKINISVKRVYQNT
jgi:hypothetical protein